MFGPSSGFLLAALCILALVAVGFGAYHLGKARKAATVGCAAGACLALIVASGIQMNRTLGYAEGWRDVPSLFGIGGALGEAVPGDVPSFKPGEFDEISAHEGDKAYDATFTREGNVLETSFVGPRSGIELPVWVWVPKDYSPEDGKTYRVILMLHGYPGNAVKIPEQLNLDKAMDSNTIVVIPSLRVDAQSPDCIDLKARPQVATWVTEDIVGMVRHNFTTSPDRSGWTIAGASAGAYCALALGFERPHIFSSIIAFSGYDEPSTGLLNRASSKMKRDYTASVMAGRQRDWPQRVYVTGTTSDPASKRLMENLKEGASDRVSVTTYLGSGGHNWGVWKNQLPAALTWLGDS